MGYTVQTPVYEGPFDLLLHLITQEQVDLYEISITTIVDAYLDEITKRRMDSDAGFDLDVATEFLVIAATLIELKTRRLLPGATGEDIDEEFALWEERDLLLSRLVECKTFKNAAQAFQGLSDAADRSVPRSAGLEDRYLAIAPDILPNLTAGKLRDALIKMLSPKPVPHVSLQHVTNIRITVQDAADRLINELPHIRRTSFRDLTGNVTDRIEVIVMFLAVLELYKQGLIELEQLENFGELKVSWVEQSSIDLRDSIEVYEG